MPALTPSLPIYATAAQASGPDVRTLTRTSPGATDSTATVAAMGLAATNTYLRPEQSVAAEAAPGPLAVGVGQGWGWSMAHNNLPGIDADDGVRFAAGDWTFAVHYSRPGGILTGNINDVSITTVLLHVSAAGAVIQEVGRGSVGGITITTTEASSNVTIPGTAFDIEPGERVRLELHVAKPAALSGDDGRFHTNSTTGLRAITAPAYARIANVTATAVGSAVVQGALSVIAGTVATAAGTATVQGAASVTANTVATAAGSSSAQASVAMVFETVGTIDVCEGGGAEIPSGLIVLRPDGRLLAIDGAVAIPDAHVRLVSYRECIEAVDEFNDAYRLLPRNGATVTEDEDSATYTVQHLPITEGADFYEYEC